MAIDRSNYNALVDETGSGNGSIWDKAAIKNVLLDPIDAALGGGSGAFTVISNTATGAVNDWAPAGMSGNTIVEWNGASDFAPTGLAGGAAGQIVIVKNITAAKIATFAHNSGSSSAANRFQNIATSAATPVAPKGFAAFYHNGTDWRLIQHDQGEWITPAYAGGTYTASAGTWTVDSGDVQIFKYRLIGRRLEVAWALGTTSVSATPQKLQITIPGGFAALTPGSHSGPHFYKDNGGAYIFGESWIAPSALTVIALFTAGFGTVNWSAATNATETYGQLAIEVS